MQCTETIAMPMRCTLAAGHDGEHHVTLDLPPDIVRQFARKLDELDNLIAWTRTRARISVVLLALSLVALGVFIWAQLS